MSRTTADVLSGSARWGVDCADALAFLAGLPDDSIDLLFTSPPYLQARTYGRSDVARTLDDWVAWMVAVVTAAAPKVKGLIAVNCEGQTRNYRYLPAPFLLLADLHRAGFNHRKPAVFHRVGIPGSGGPDWLRNDWEPVVCVTRPGRLPWSDPTACGKPPKYAPGGELSHRDKDGTRRNAFGVRVDKPIGTRATGNKTDREGYRAVSRFVVGLATKGSRNGDTITGDYAPPVKANPGNVLRYAVGGNLMGHNLAHENEAPFPLKLAEFFVLSFCPPGGVVCDPFAGSGTTCHAAVLHGRRFVGCDLRQSQVELVGRRMASVTPSLLEG